MNDSAPPKEAYERVRDVLGTDYLSRPVQRAIEAVWPMAYRTGQGNAARCSGCDHLLSNHSEGGCWYSVSTARQGSDVVCVCVAEWR